MEEKQIIDTLSNLKHRIFPRPFERLALNGSNLVGVEIGVYKADHAISLLENALVEHLFLIDPYDLYDAYTEGKNHYGQDQDKLSEAEIVAREKLAKYSNRITWVKKLSSDCLSEIPDNLDFVYIDGNHQRPFVDEDIYNYYPKVKQGGILGGHDMYNGFCTEHNGVVQAVTEFACKTKLQLYIELPDWWVVKE